MKMLLAVLALTSFCSFASAGECDKKIVERAHSNPNFSFNFISCDNETGEVQIENPHYYTFREGGRPILYKSVVKNLSSNKMVPANYSKATLDSLCQKYGLSEIVSYHENAWYAGDRVGVFFLDESLEHIQVRQQSQRSLPLHVMTCR